jgi:multidrug efflux pump subunit AcrB
MVYGVMLLGLGGARAMGIVLIEGLVSSTLFTLFLIPVTASLCRSGAQVSQVETSPVT